MRAIIAAIIVALSFTAAFAGNTAGHSAQAGSTKHNCGTFDRGRC